MDSGNYWLLCTNITHGMLPGEYAIETTTVDGKKISLFLNENPQIVEPEKNLIRINVLQRSPLGWLVYLPASPFEVSSRFVNVPKDNVVER